MTVTLRPIDRSNWLQCVRLQVAPEQRSFVASNAFSLAQAAYSDQCYPLAIYDGEEMVGFTMYWLDPDDQNWWITRLMVDARYQRRGYARAAMEQLIDRMKALPGCTEIHISFEPENVVADAFYQRLGFVKTGAIICDEMEAVLKWDGSR